MGNIKVFIKALQKKNYPNSTPSALSIAKVLGYNPKDFIFDLQKEIGIPKTFDFIKKTFESLGLMSIDGMRIDLSDRVGDEGSYAYVRIDDFDIVEDFEGDEVVHIDYDSWDILENKLVFENEETSIQDIYDDAGLGEMGEYHELVEEILDTCTDEIWMKTCMFLQFEQR